MSKVGYVIYECSQIVILHVLDNISTVIYDWLQITIRPDSLANSHGFLLHLELKILYHIIKHGKSINNWHTQLWLVKIKIVGFLLLQPNFAMPELLPRISKLIQRLCFLLENM